MTKDIKYIYSIKPRYATSSHSPISATTPWDSIHFYHNTLLNTSLPYIMATKRGAKAASRPKPTLPAPAVTTELLGLGWPTGELDEVATGTPLDIGATGTPVEGRGTVPLPGREKKPLGAAAPDGQAGAGPVV